MPGIFIEPNWFYNSLNADSVKIQNLPIYPPGAKNVIFNRLTFIVWTPGIFLSAFIKFSDSSFTITHGPLLSLYLLFLYLPFPGLKALALIHLSTSSYAPNLFNNSTASLVLEILPTSSSSTSGN